MRFVPVLTTQSQTCMFVIFATGVFLLKEVWRDIENQVIVNQLVFPVKYAANVFTGKTRYRGTWRYINRQCCSTIQRLVRQMWLLIYRRRRHCHHRPLLFLLLRATARGPCTTFAPRHSLARKRWRDTNRLFIVNLAAFEHKMLTEKCCLNKKNRLKPFPPFPERYKSAYPNAFFSWFTPKTASRIQHGHQSFTSHWTSWSTAPPNWPIHWCPMW